MMLGCCQYTVCSSVPSEAKMRIVGLVRCCPSLPPVWPKADDLMSISWRVALARLSAMVPGNMLTRYLDAWLCSFGWHSYILFFDFRDEPVQLWLVILIQNPPCFTRFALAARAEDGRALSCHIAPSLQCRVPLGFSLAQFVMGSLYLFFCDMWFCAFECLRIVER